MTQEKVDYSYKIVSTRKASKREIADTRQQSPNLIFTDDSLVKITVKTKYGRMKILGLNYHLVENSDSNVDTKANLTYIVESAIDNRLGIKRQQEVFDEE